MRSGPCFARNFFVIRNATASAEKDDSLNLPFLYPEKCGKILFPPGLKLICSGDGVRPSALPSAIVRHDVHLVSTKLAGWWAVLGECHLLFMYVLPAPWPLGKVDRIWTRSDAHLMQAYLIQSQGYLDNFDRLYLGHMLMKSKILFTT